MRNLRISAKLIVSFAIVIVLAIAVGVVGYLGMGSINKAQSDMYDSNLLAIEAMGNLRALFNQERSDMRAIYLATDDPQKIKSIMDGFAAHNQTAADNFALYESTILAGTEADEAAYYAAKTVYLGAFATMKADTFALLEQGRYDEAYKIFIERGADIIPPITSGFTESAAQNNQWAADANKAGDTLFARLSLTLLIVLVAAVIIAMALAFYISGLISKPLIILTQFMKKAGEAGDIMLSKEEAATLEALSKIKDEVGQCIGSSYLLVRHLFVTSRKLEAIAGGDLTVDVSLLSDRDTMGLSLQKMLENLNQMFSEINSATAQVTIGSKQIADGAQSLAQGSTEQASAVQQLSASIAEVASKTKKNADMATRAANLAEDIKQNAEKGNMQMDQMMQAVKEINEASQSISKVISVIDNIAFQTNILALNAAVEAARAGQHGKGFAVVAEEVRSLASKSAEAAKETGSLIANSMEKAEMGARIAGETAGSLVEIVSGINESTKIVGDIATSSEAQALAISEINGGIDQVAQVVQQNSATAEESAAASEQMSGQANALEELVSRFQLKGAPARLGGGSARPARQIAEKSSYSNNNSGMGKY